MWRGAEALNPRLLSYKSCQGTWSIGGIVAALSAATVSSSLSKRNRHFFSYSFHIRWILSVSEENREVKFSCSITGAELGGSTALNTLLALNISAQVCCRGFRQCTQSLKKVCGFCQMLFNASFVIGIGYRNQNHRVTPNSEQSGLTPW